MIFSQLGLLKENEKVRKACDLPSDFSIKMVDLQYLRKK
jgi:hypothetical protein